MATAVSRTCSPCFFVFFVNTHHTRYVKCLCLPSVSGVCTCVYVYMFEHMNAWHRIRNDSQNDADVKTLGDDVKAFARRWPMPGFEASELKFTEMDH